MARKILKTIKLKHGNQLTFEVNENNEYNWYRNGKKINKDTFYDYKYFDEAVGKYRKLASEFKLKNPSEAKFDGDFEYIPRTPIYMDKLSELSKIAEKERRKLDYHKNYVYPIGDRFINLKTNGRMNLATIPINQLDSIAINSGRSNTPIKQNLGLVGKEGTFGGHSNALGNPWRTDIDKNYSIYELLNNHAFELNPEEEYRLYIEKQLSKKGAIYDDDLVLKLEKDIDYHLKKGIKRVTPKYSDNYMQDAFLRYQANPYKYNPGQGNYVQMVNNIANEVWNDKSIQNWWNTEGRKYYEKGKSQRKRRSLED